jgi:hypothetical protein
MGRPLVQQLRAERERRRGQVTKGCGARQPGHVAFGQEAGDAAVAGAIDEQGAAGRTEGVAAGGAADVAGVDPVEAPARLFAGPQQGFARRGGCRELPGRVVGGEVQGHRAAEAGDEVDQRLDGGLVVVVAGNDEVRQLQVHARRDELLDGPEHRRQAGLADAAVEAVVHRLEVDVRRIDQRQQFGQRLPVQVAVGDQHHGQSGGARGNGRVAHELVPDQRLAVGEGDADGTLLPGRRDQVGGCRRARGRVRLLAQRPVLAEPAVQVAARSGHRQDVAAGMEVVERLLLDGIEGSGRDAPVVERRHHPAAVRARAAGAGLPLAQPAADRAQVARGLAVGLRAPPAAAGIDVGIVSPPSGAAARPWPRPGSPARVRRCGAARPGAPARAACGGSAR